MKKIMASLMTVIVVFVLSYQTPLSANSISEECSSGAFVLKLYEYNYIVKSSKPGGKLQVTKNCEVIDQFDVWLPACKSGTCPGDSYGPNASLPRQNTKVALILSPGDRDHDGDFYGRSKVFAFSWQLVQVGNTYKKYFFSVHGVKSSNDLINDSHGCIRMSEQDGIKLAKYVSLDTDLIYATGSPQSKSSKPPKQSNLQANRVSSVLNGQQSQPKPNPQASQPKLQVKVDSNNSSCPPGKNTISDGPKKGSCSTCPNGTSYYWSTGDYKCSKQN